MSTGPSMTSRSMIAPTIFVPMGGYGYGAGMGYGFGNIVSLAFIAIVLMAFLDNIKNMFGGDGIQLGGDAIAVARLISGATAGDVAVSAPERPEYRTDYQAELMAGYLAQT